VLDDKGRELARGKVGDPLNLLPGSYDLKTGENQKVISFAVQSGRVTSLTPRAEGF
jgi:hypothetical protein